MNKKKLSVVMAGAMLATSVAPVLAAEVTAEEVKMSEKALLAKKVVDLAKTKMISTNSYIKTNLVESGVKPLMEENTSAYGIKVLDKDGIVINLEDTFGVPSNKLDSSSTITYDLGMIESILKADELEKDMTVQVVERKTTEFLGQIIPGTQIEATGDTSKYTTSDFADLDNQVVNASTNAFVKEVKANDIKTEATVTLEAISNLGAEKEENVTIKLDLNSKKLNFDLPLDKDGKLTDKVQDCVGFETAVTAYKKSDVISSKPEVKSAYKMVDDSAKEEKVTYLANELYDGFALTAKGTEIKSDIDNAAEVAKENNRTDRPTVELALPKGVSSIDNLQLVNGVASFTVTYFDSYKDNDPANTNDKPSKVITVKSTNLEEIKSLYNMIKDNGFRVGIIGGDNRYATAVNVAKQQGIKEIQVGNVGSKDNHLVLVNGDSLVDGLSAAPLAATLKWDANSNPGTAVLLSKADSLPEETKEYLESLLVNMSKKNTANVTIHLVGGEAVLSESLVDELKEMGFTVERHGGDDREETSLEVASAVENGTKKGAFIVGGNGEADAMSIASVAAENGTPIIVSSVHGLTKDALKYVKARENKTMTIVGGESVVSAEEYAKLDELTDADHPVKRISGKNRFETNAAVIKEFYNANGIKNSEGVVLVKDGVATKKELVDALSAANYAAGKNAPIILASTSLKDVQKNALLNINAKSDIKTKGTIAQVGIGAERTVLETIAELFGISNVK